MIGFKTLAAAALLSAIASTSASAQAAFGEPAAFQAQNPDRDVLNGGAPTPAARLGLEQRYGGLGASYAQAPYAQVPYAQVPYPNPAPARRRHPHR
jgi:hypothetical protein